MKIAVLGDIYPGEVSRRLLESSTIVPLLGGLSACLQTCQSVLANLEGPVGVVGSPVPKIGPSHRIPAACLDGIKAMGVSFLALANNHVMDSGLEGLRQTMLECDRRGIITGGAGATLAEASQLRIMTLDDGLRVAVLSVTEHEFGFATERQGGSNPLDIVQFVRTVQGGRGKWDRLVVLLHAGTEYDPFPRPELVKICRFMVEQGADLVVCQQPHCAGCVESYLNGHIVYGQGYFIFDELRCRSGTQEGFVVMLGEDHGASTRLSLVPYRHSSEAPGPLQMNASEAEAFLAQLRLRSECLQSEEALQDKWADYCRRNSRRYLALVHGYGRTLRRIDQKIDFLRYLYRPRHLRMLLHLFRCESHREAIIKILSESPPA